MNVFSRIGCRLVHGALRLAQPFLPRRTPTVLEQTTDVAPYLRQHGVERALLVTGPNVRGRGLTLPLEDALRASGIVCTVFDRSQVNPTVAAVDEAYACYCKGHCQAIVAFGGGSPLDLAKAVGARVAYPRHTLAALKGTLRVRRRIPLLIAVPTTAGSGSEISPAAVITDSETHHKYAMMSYSFVPSCAVLDPAVTASLPPALTATTGMDALTHAVEAYVGHLTTRRTRQWSTEAVQLIFANLPTAVADGNDLAARAALLRASHLAGRAFSRSFVGYVHAIAHSLGGAYNVSHGLANAVLLPVVLRAYGKRAHKALRRLGIAIGVASRDDTPAVGAQAFLAAIDALNSRLGIPDRLDVLREEDVPALSRTAAREANPLYPVPKLLSAAELEHIYRSVL